MNKTVDIRSEIKNLVSQLNKYRDSYYNKSVSLVTDSEYDKLFDELQSYENKLGIIYSNSPTQSVGYEVKSKLTKVQHSIPLLSLDKTKDVSMIEKFIGDKPVLLLLKYDGLTVELIYDNGELQQASTRGNGTEGEDITHNAKTFMNLPLKIGEKGFIKIVGEAIIHRDDFEKINSTLTDDEKYKNPRNLAAGSVRQLDSKLCSERCVRFYAFDVLEGLEKYNSRYDMFHHISLLGFDTAVGYQYNFGVLEPMTDVKYGIESLKEQAEVFQIPIDGLVARYDDITYSKSLGRTSHHFNDGLAFKFDDESATTILRGIEWSMGRTCITPVALFDTVDLDNTEVSRASLHNISIVEELELGIGDEIVVVKANQIIPQIIENNTRSNTIIIPNICPVCGAKTEIKQANDSKVLTCTNDNCSGKVLSKFVHFVSKSAMNIDGLSDATLEKFIEAGWLKTFTDIYRLDRYKEEIINMDGFGKKSYDKLWKTIQDNRKVKLENFIVALGIPNIGRSASKIISKYFNGDWFKFEEAVLDGFDFTSFPDFGETMNDSIHKYLNDFRNLKWFGELTIIFDFEKTELKQESSNSVFKDKTIVVTGSLEHFNRKSIQEKIEEIGAKMGSSVSSKTDYLLTNDISSGSSKNKKAQELGVEIIDEKTFLSMIGE